MNGLPQGQERRVDSDASVKTLDDLRQAEQRALLSSPSHPNHDLFKQVRVCLDRQDTVSSRTPEQNDNLAAALAVEARRNEMRVNHVVLSKDGERAFAVEGDLNSPARRVSYVETAQAASQPIERSGEQLAQLSREQDQRDRRQAQEQDRQRQPEAQREAPLLGLGPRSL
ncbi:hypothetical protein ASD78_10190 [Lysobacter sp. Root667]|uniref:XVIPCD domain-containing protein n=1 Tax=Lysobacter sp. Root667 TaxID=1736581 RepID=UPI0006F991C9|nr:XVIPCD domain-containing protein [Lysobacter sp. Root667]KRA74694.1 hypothetical protein ASD78_10190 [Lysobacter sp. Root667]